MQTTRRNIFTTIQTEGAILPADLLQRIAEGDQTLDGLTPQAYHLIGGEKLNEAINRAWNRLLGAWATFRAALTKLPADDAATTVTRERWLLPLFQELGYGRLIAAKTLEIGGKSYPISHGWDRTPLHLVGCRIDLDRRTAGVAGASRTSPHSLMQEALNRSEDFLWGMVTNGFKLRILRDNVSLTRQAYVEFDLQTMFEGEVYADFVLFWLLAHQSRVENLTPLPPSPKERGETPLPFGEGTGVGLTCWLEKWSQVAQAQGMRVLDHLQEGVAEAIRALGRGFLIRPENAALRQKIQRGDLAPQEYYRQLLRQIYRLIFLFVAEDRGLLCAPAASAAAKERYLRYYSTTRLRHLAERRKGSDHVDLWRGLRLVFAKLGEDGGCPELGLPPLGSFLWNVAPKTPLLGGSPATPLLGGVPKTPLLGGAGGGFPDAANHFGQVPTPTPSQEGNSGKPTPNPSQEGNSGKSTPNPSQEGNSGKSTPNPSQEGNSGKSTPNPSQEGNSGKPTPIPSQEGNSGKPALTLFQEGSSGKPTPIPSQEGNSVATPDLDGLDLSNRDLLDAIRALSLTVDRNARRAVDYKNLGSEELGSVYESLLEYHPALNLSAGTFSLEIAAGNERKTTGSHYTPTPLIACLLDSALDPVLKETLARDCSADALLNLKICDPACGSGHFLIAAAHRLAKQLATIRTGDDEPAPEAIRAAMREVVGRCLYGVDINPMAVELCKFRIWLEALEPGKPLSFLDHRIQCGNSLLGATPTLLKDGIPDAAFEPLEGDDKKVCQSAKKQNKTERTGQQTLFQYDNQPWNHLGNLAQTMLDVGCLADETIAEVREKEGRYAAFVRSTPYEFGRLWADAFCAAFVWRKQAGALPPITEIVFRNIERTPYSVSPPIKEEIRRLAAQYQFFHWHLAFPDVFRVPANGSDPEQEAMGWNGGFDVVLGNPPWERVKLQEKEWFAPRHAEIANAPNAAKRRSMIEALAHDDPALYQAFQDARRAAEGESHFIRSAGCYPLCGRGDVNTYTIFAELNRQIQRSAGRVGCIVPSGIATDDTTKFFFQDLMEAQALISLYDFENREGIFPAVHRSFKFCLLTLTGADRPARQGAEFVFFAQNTAELRDQERRFTLSAAEIALLNPNTRTCPIFRSKRDAELTKAIYQRVPILLKEGETEENPWGISFLRMFDMANDSHLFRTREQLEGEGWQLQGNVFVRDDDCYLPLYEAKMVHQFDHRWASYKGVETDDLTSEEKKNPNIFVMPRYWVAMKEIIRRVNNQPIKHLLGFRDITNTTNERTAIFNVLAFVAVGHKFPLVFFENMKPIQLMLGFLANVNSLVFDYVVRQKFGGTSLSYFVLKQIPILPPKTFINNVLEFITPRVLELTYTAWDLEAFAKDCGYDGPPFRWDEERRFLLRCELDAAYFHLYGIARDDAAYILDTFPIVKRKDEAKYGEYRTKRVILDIYDAMRHAQQTSTPYQTRLDPPPADPRVAHPPR